MLSSTTSSVWLVTLTKNALISKFSLYLCYFPKKNLSRTYDKEINEFQTIKKLVVFALSYHNHSYQQYGLFIDYIYNEYIYTLSISVSVLYERTDIPQSNSQNVLDLLRMRVILKLFLLSFMLSFQSSKLKLSSKYQLLVSVYCSEMTIPVTSTKKPRIMAYLHFKNDELPRRALMEMLSKGL